MKFLRKVSPIATGAITNTVGGDLTVQGNINIQAGNNASIGTVDNYNLSLRTNNADRIFITNTGNVGIGTASPLEKLDVIGNIQNILSADAPPTRIGAVTLNEGEDYGTSIAVSGRYAYIVTETFPAKVVVVDISNPASPTRIGAVTLNEGEDSGASIAVSGRYAYIVTMTVPAKVVVVDISNPASPTRIGAVTLNEGEDNGTSIAVSGRYAYIVTETVPTKVVVVDIRGTEISSLIAHSLEAGSLQVRKDLTVYDHLKVGGGINVGPGGIYSAGPFSLISGSTGATSSALDIRNSAGTNLLYVRDDGNVGIGTEAPLAKLHVVGDAIINGAFSTIVTTITTDTTLDNTYHIILANATNGTITITLPSATTCSGRQYIIKKVDSSTNAVTVTPQTGQTIDGQTSISITTQNDLRRIVSDGTNWYII